MTTTVFLRCVIDSTEVLPDEAALCKALAAALIKRTAVTGARVSEVLRRAGEVETPNLDDLLTVVPNGLTSTVSPAQLDAVERFIHRPGMSCGPELVEAVANTCPESAPAGGPHVYNPKDGESAVCLKCGRIRPLAQPVFEHEVIPGPIPVSPVCFGSHNGRGLHDFDPTNRNQGRVCPNCGAANPEPPKARKGAFAGDTLMER